MKLVFKNGSYIDFNKGVWVGLKAIVFTVLLITILAIVGDWDMRKANEKSPAATKQQDFKQLKKHLFASIITQGGLKWTKNYKKRKKNFIY